MEIKVSLKNKAFFFLGKISLKKNDPPTVINLSDLSDPAIKLIASSVANGTLSSDRTPEEIRGFLSVKIKTDDGKFIDESVAEIFIEEVTKEIKKVEDDDESEGLISVAVEDLVFPGGRTVTDEELADLLRGTSKAVQRKISSADLSETDREALLTLESSGKDRVTIKALIKG